MLTGSTQEGTIGNDVIESTDVGGNSPHPMAIALLACVMWCCVTPYCIPLRVARVKKFKINVTSHLKIIILIIKDVQISKCDIIFENGRFSAFEG